MKGYSAYIAFALAAAFFWSWLQDQVSPQNLVVGFLLGGALVLFWGRALMKGLWGPFHGRQLVAGVIYLLILLKEILRANLKVFRVILRRRLNIRPGVVAVPTDLEGDLPVITLANSITLTPGTFTLVVSRDQKTLYVHVLDMETPEAVRAQIKEHLERPIRRVSG